MFSWLEIKGSIASLIFPLVVLFLSLFSFFFVRYSFRYTYKTYKSNFSSPIHSSMAVNRHKASFTVIFSLNKIIIEKSICVLFYNIFSLTVSTAYEYNISIANNIF